MASNHTDCRLIRRNASGWASAALLAAVLSLALTGCNAFHLPFGAKSAREEALRKQVEKDSFPTAKQNGL